MSAEAERWEGAVTGIRSDYHDYFTADVVNVDDDTQWAHVSIWTRDVAETDRDLLALGALFFWTIDDEGSRIEFRRADPAAVAEKCVGWFHDNEGETR